MQIDRVDIVISLRLQSLAINQQYTGQQMSHVVFNKLRVIWSFHQSTKGRDVRTAGQESGVRWRVLLKWKDPKRAKPQGRNRKLPSQLELVKWVIGFYSCRVSFMSY